ncbi:hypothetical protein T484DRAFT_3045678 [Baffinella frigidus]|nr:hypothetical protein T484DRAFT_3045678 [Cryptophyta sp. CCMP2293]
MGKFTLVRRCNLVREFLSTSRAHDQGISIFPHLQSFVTRVSRPAPVPHDELRPRLHPRLRRADPRARLDQRSRRGCCVRHDADGQVAQRALQTRAASVQWRRKEPARSRLPPQAIEDTTIFLLRDPRRPRGDDALGVRLCAPSAIASERHGGRPGTTQEREGQDDPELGGGVGGLGPPVPRTPEGVEGGSDERELATAWSVRVNKGLTS